MKPTPDPSDKEPVSKQPAEDIVSADDLAALMGEEPRSPASGASAQAPDPAEAETLGDLISADELAALTGQNIPMSPPANPATGLPPKAAPPPATPKKDAAPMFGPIEPAEVEVQQENSIGLLMDVPLRVSIELGRVVMTVQQVLGLGRGSIVELDRLAGEPVDILVNDKPIGRGEVVVIDENFGVKITELFEPKG